MNSGADVKSGPLIGHWLCDKKISQQASMHMHYGSPHCSMPGALLWIA